MKVVLMVLAGITAALLFHWAGWEDGKREGRKEARLEYHAAKESQPAPRYLVTYVYHTEENGPVAGYGFAEVDDISNLDQLHADLMRDEMDMWKRMGKPGHMLSMSFISINELVRTK